MNLQGSPSTLSSRPKQLTCRANRDAASSEALIFGGGGNSLYLDAVLVEEARQTQTRLLIQGFAEDDQLLKQEHSPLLHPTEQNPLRVGHHEGVLEQQPALGCNLPLGATEKVR